MQSPINDQSAELIARRFRALAEPNRLLILDRLRERGEASVGELAAAIGASQQNVSKHLGALRDEGFVERRKSGTSAIYRIADPGVLTLCEQVCAGIESRLAEMANALGG